MKNSSTRILIATMMALKPADSRMPHTSTAVMSATMPKARTLKTMGMPAMCGAAASTSALAPR